jgi:hypothetical protein
LFRWLALFFRSKLVKFKISFFLKELVFSFVSFSEFKNSPKSSIHSPYESRLTVSKSISRSEQLQSLSESREFLKLLFFIETLFDLLEFFEQLNDFFETDLFIL